MRIGVIYCAYQTEDLVEASLRPWIEARQTRLAGHDYVICAVSVPFEGFPNDQPEDRTRAILGAHAQAGDIDHAIVRDHPMAETEARGAALKWLVEQGCDTLWQVDSDEPYETAQIAAICDFVAARPLVTWFRLCLRNAVFDSKTYLVEPFTPPRIHRVTTVRGCFYTADGFCDDNNVSYRDSWHTGRPDTAFPSATVPRQLAWIKHLSWLNDDRSRRKVAYQQGRGWTCSFDWDDAQGGLIWRAGQPVPETARDA